MWEEIQNAYLAQFSALGTSQKYIFKKKKRYTENTQSEMCYLTEG